MNEVTVMTDDLRIKRRYGWFFSVPCYGTIDRDLFDKLIKFQSNISEEVFWHLETYQKAIREKLAISKGATVWRFNARFKKGITKDGITEDSEFVRMRVFMGKYGYHDFDQLREITKLDIYKWKALNSVCSVLNLIIKPFRRTGVKTMKELKVYVIARSYGQESLKLPQSMDS